MGFDSGDLSSIKKVTSKRSLWTDFYHTMLRLRWWQFFCCFIFGYLLINALFASIYYFGGDSIQNANPDSYWDAFLFSFQTSSTIGYGRLVPNSTLAHFVMIFDTLSGMIFVAIATGMAFAKFSRPTARVLFSHNMLIAKVNGAPMLMFRLGNTRRGNIIDAEIKVVMSKPVKTKEGMSFRKIEDLKLVRDHSPLFGITWNVMHPIDSESPLYNMPLEKIQSGGINFIISLTGIDDVYSQTVHDRHIYLGNQVINAKMFKDVMEIDSKGGAIVNYQNFHEVIS